MVFRVYFCLLLAIGAISALPIINKEKIRFKLSAKGLPDKDNLGTIDPYVEVFYTQGGSNSESTLGRTEAIDDNEHPEWSKIFEFDFDRSKNQQFHFLIWDRDHAREDDKGGQVWIDVNDYVDKGQLVNALLDKQGYLTVKSADPTVQQHGRTPGTLPYAPGSPDTATLSFRVSANGLSDKDNFGKTDPYAEIYTANGLTGKATKIGRTATLSGTTSPQWGDVFTVNWDRRKDQRLLVKVFDNDRFREDDKAGLAWLELNDYVAKGQALTTHTNKKGTVTIHRADGLPVAPYSPTGPTQHSSQFPSSPVNPQPPHHGQPSSQFPQKHQTVPQPGQHASQLPQQQHHSPQPGHSSQLPQPGQYSPQFPQSGHPTQFPQQQQRGPQSPVVPHSPSKLPQPTPKQPQQSQFPLKIKFRLAASNLDDKDLIGTSDPYVKVYITQDGTPETLIKTGSKLSDTENPQWDDIYEFDYNPSKHQKLRFLVLDEDDNLRDDELGNVSLEASELEQRGYVILRLTHGSLTVTKV